MLSKVGQGGPMVALGGSRQPKAGQGVPRRVKAALDGSRWPHGGPRQHHGGPRQPLDGNRRALGRSKQP